MVRYLLLLAAIKRHPPYLTIYENINLQVLLLVLYQYKLYQLKILLYKHKKETHYFEMGPFFRKLII